MSFWTKIKGQIVLSTNVKSFEERSSKIESLSRLPKITGSEGSVEYCVFEIGKYWTDRFIKRAEEGYSEAEVKVVLSIYGNLRDRMLYKTNREFLRFLYRLPNKGWYLDEIDVSISDGLDTFTFNEKFRDKFTGVEYLMREFYRWQKKNTSEPTDEDSEQMFLDSQV